MKVGMTFLPLLNKHDAAGAAAPAY